ncbi:MAG TPA: hypothetical protein VMF14_18780 [Solirubrobacteraceae bacterium]|nr:hypothetical protein [Solirubrobacteraceae bacterium]
MPGPLAINLQALRVLVGPDIKIVPGRAVMARVVQAPAGQKGSLSIAGMLLDAELPDNVQAGDDLRLVVRDVNAERVLLAITDPHEEQQAEQSQGAPAEQGQAAQAQQAPAHAQAPDPSLAAQPAIPLPGGGQLQVTERDAGGAGRPPGERQNIMLRYDAPALGSMDLRFQMDAGALALQVTLPGGRAHDLAQAAADSLRQALARVAPGRAVSVTVTPRREPLDLYA